MINDFTIVALLHECTSILFSVGVIATTILIGKNTQTWVLDDLKVIGGLAAVAAAVFSWTYQNGSRRLGVIDLFGCEISVSVA